MWLSNFSNIKYSWVLQIGSIQTNQIPRGIGGSTQLIAFEAMTDWEPDYENENYHNGNHY